MKISQTIALGITAILALTGCRAPRNIYSAVPFTSPVRLEKGQWAIEPSYLSNKSSVTGFDSVGNRDRGYDLHLSYMYSRRVKLVGYVGHKSEKNTTLYRPNSNPDLFLFDSSVIYTKRISAGLGFQIFSPMDDNILTSYSGILGYQSMNLKDAGLDKGNPYTRFFKMNQIVFTNQFSRLYKLTKYLNVAYIGRLSLAYYLPSKTDYTDNEKFRDGFKKDGQIEPYLCLLGLYADIQPLKNLPLIFTIQWYNDSPIWNHFMGPERLSQGNYYVKGTGGSYGIKYLFRTSRTPH